MKQYLLGLDNGGTISKAALFDLLGNEIAVVSAQTPLYTPRPGYAERDMEMLWEANCRVIRQVMEKANVAPEAVIGLSVCGHGKGLYLWGKTGIISNGFVSTDRRAWRYPQKWRDEGTFDKLYPQLCQQLVSGQQAPILAWIKDNQREVYDKIHYVFAVKDYIRFRLTGEAFFEMTDISGSGLMDVKNACIDRGLLEALGIGEMYDKIPPLKLTTDICGRITKQVAETTGLSEGTPVTGGMFDIDSCAVAMGVIDETSLCTITGTWSINEFPSKTPVLGTAIAMNSLFAVPGYYLIEECSPTSAGNLDWQIENLVKYDPLPDGESRYELVGKMVEEIAPEDCEVYYLPFLYGSNAHPQAKASFLGLTSFHTKAHMLRAVYEGVVFSAKSHIDKLLSVREKPAAIRLAGGVVNSAMWVQMFADILGIPIETVEGVKELGALGCAISTAVALEVYPDFQTATQKMVRVNPSVTPDARRTEIYAKKYTKYLALRDALDPVWDLLES